MDKFADSRPPVSVTRIGKYTVTIFDQEAYDESLKRYPENDAKGEIKRKQFPLENDKPAFAKQKPQARYNWITPLDKPLGGIA